MEQRRDKVETDERTVFSLVAERIGRSMVAKAQASSQEDARRCQAKIDADVKFALHLAGVRVP